jgi:glycosyltransferase involved in cell wall biosynthesis
MGAAGKCPPVGWAELFGLWHPMREMITIVGGVPEPGGGVTNFIYRVARHFPRRVRVILDLYPHTRKRKPPGVQIDMRPKSFALGMAWLWWKLAVDESRTVYFNFSSSRFLLLAWCFPKRTGVKWLLTLHHGLLGLPNGSVARVLIRWSLRRYDAVGYIGENQRDFFAACGVCADRLEEIVTYLPYVGEADERPDPHVLKAMSALRGRYRKLVLASGYPAGLYRYDWTLEYLKSQPHDAGVGVVICVYGQDRDGVLPKLRERVAGSANVRLFEELDAATFQAVLNQCDIYVRPTAVDSYGVAVAEAVDAGLQVIASDACKRRAGAHIFGKDDKQAFYRLLDVALAEGLPPVNELQGDSLAVMRTFLRE